MGGGQTSTLNLVCAQASKNTDPSAIVTHLAPALVVGVREAEPTEDDVLKTTQHNHYKGDIFGSHRGPRGFEAPS